MRALPLGSSTNDSSIILSERCQRNSSTIPPRLHCASSPPPTSPPPRRTPPPSTAIVAARQGRKEAGKGVAKFWDCIGRHYCRRSCLQRQLPFIITTQQHCLAQHIGLPPGDCQRIVHDTAPTCSAPTTTTTSRTTVGPIRKSAGTLILFRSEVLRLPPATRIVHFQSIAACTRLDLSSHLLLHVTIPLPHPFPTLLSHCNCTSRVASSRPLDHGLTRSLAAVIAIALTTFVAATRAYRVTRQPSPIRIPICIPA